ncbi:hypothetical protein ANOM_003717 [Aspergillus nomiae NRRL 13137]|uniref:Uncharacterized protein n=1 Tax=Aspergillus nomiae NRRL (strain ATCC 15546 / NRRL 13137 / CBS 260.88 / M93) TaxID=1509407 RepID=A0A0L1JAX4_ASPN3|nr:uncharacterized protein ANOM_003717 [Aspergillus nomiae NRRL 13137]KNG88872.1 hypothetical protein ANOM_003717 [Aspergillus nomiae NRRL 13137]
MEHESSSDSENAPFLRNTEMRPSRPSSSRVVTYFWPEIRNIFSYLKAALVQILSAISYYQTADRSSEDISQSFPLAASDASTAMKVLNPLFFILAASKVARALPAEENIRLSGEIAVFDPNSLPELAQSMSEEHHALIRLEKRATCETINKVIRRIGHNRHKLAYIVYGSGLAWAICGLTGHDECDKVGGAVLFTMGLIFTAAADYSGADPVPVPELPGAMKVPSYQASLTAALSQSDLEYTAIDPAPLQEAPEKRSEDEPHLLERFLIRGLRPVSNATAQSDTDGQDIFVHHYDNGGTVLHLPIGRESLSAEKLNKKYDHPGLKISFTTRRVSKMSRQHQTDMASGIASMWEYYARTTPMNEYIGFVETGHHANFYFRIIPELKGFGTNYESVDVCGGMAGML